MFLLPRDVLLAGWGVHVERFCSEYGSLGSVLVSLPLFVAIDHLGKF